MIETNYTSPEFYFDLSQIPSIGINGRIQYSPECVNIGSKVIKVNPQLNLTNDENNLVVCCEYANPEYKKHIPRVLTNARIPQRTIVYRDILQTDKRRPGENIAVRLTEKIMGIDKDAPELVTTYVNLRNQPHQRSYVDDHNRGISSAPMIYKTWRNPTQRYSRPPPGPLSVQYGPQNPCPPRDLKLTKRPYPEGSDITQKTNKRVKFDNEKLSDVKQELLNFFDSAKAQSIINKNPNPNPKEPTNNKMNNRFSPFGDK